METRIFRANGKLMISGEYLVLSGARALAVPLRLGQQLKLRQERARECSISWVAKTNGREWFRSTFRGEGLEFQRTNDAAVASRLRELLLAARELKPAFLKDPLRVEVETDMEFHPNWGLGSSSSLVYNLARWAGVDAYTLQFKTFGGSGYDVACAGSRQAILYRYRGQAASPMVETRPFFPLFHRQLLFVYSGRKASTSSELDKYDPAQADEGAVKEASALSEALASAGHLQDFMSLLHEHESLVGRVIGQTPVQQARFSDFPGVIKSLGAWGGDFILAASPEGASCMARYFDKQGLGVRFPFKNLVMHPDHHQTENHAI